MDLTPEQIELIKPIAESFWPTIVEIRREAHTYRLERTHLIAVVPDLQKEAKSKILSNEVGNPWLRSLNERINRYMVIIEHLQNTIQWHDDLANKCQEEMFKKFQESGVDLTKLPSDEWPEFLDDMT